MERPLSDGKQHQPQGSNTFLCITKRYKLKTVQVYAPITSNPDEDINNFHNDVDETLGK